MKNEKKIHEYLNSLFSTSEVIGTKEFNYVLNEDNKFIIVNNNTSIKASDELYNYIFEHIADFAVSMGICSWAEKKLGYNGMNLTVQSILDSSYENLLIFKKNHNLIDVLFQKMIKKSEIFEGSYNNQLIITYNNKDFLLLDVESNNSLFMERNFYKKLFNAIDINEIKRTEEKIFISYLQKILLPIFNAEELYIVGDFSQEERKYLGVGIETIKKFI